MRLFAELTAVENIMIKNRLTDRYSEREILQLLAELEIDNKAGQLAARLSIGQQQRVAIVRSLCQPFDFIILDEPVSHLDTRNNNIVASMVKRVADENHAGIITTSVGNPLLLKEAQHVKL
jgi:ABC-type lipoprotein export system ATPase subunit